MAASSPTMGVTSGATHAPVVVAVTGASGFVASELIAQLLEVLSVPVLQTRDGTGVARIFQSLFF